MACVEEQHREDFVLEAGQLGAQVVLHRHRRSERLAALHLLFDDLARGFQNLVGVRRPIAPTAIAHHQRSIEREGKVRSEEHTSELQSLMRISYAVFCLKKKKINQNKSTIQKQRKTNHRRKTHNG